MGERKSAVVSAVAAHVLTWVVGLWLVLGPVYQGFSVTAMTAGGVASESKRLTATLTEVNGLGVLLLLLAPVVLTALALLATLLTSIATAKRRVFLWVLAVLLLGFCGGIFKKCVNGQAVYPLSEQDGLKAQERRYTAYGKEKH